MIPAQPDVLGSAGERIIAQRRIRSRITLIVVRVGVPADQVVMDADVGVNLDIEFVRIERKRG